MTVVGKILVFVNLLFTLIVGSLVTMVYVTRTHWVESFNAANSQLQIAAASEQTYKKEVEKAQAERDAKIAEKDAELKKAVADIQTLRDANRALADDSAAQKLKLSGHATTAEVAQKEVERRQEAADTLRSNLKEERAANAKLVLEKQQLLERAVAADLQLRSAQERNKGLEQQLQEMTKELVRARAGGAVARTSGKNPPPEDVQGLVKTADPASGLVTITIGSDAGLSKGQTLEVFRLSNVPSQSKYLGTIRILEVTPTQAVGQPTGRMASPPQPGDRVASQILGSS
jgi:hypothetical protein